MAVALAIFVIVTVVWNIRERRRQLRLAESRAPLDSAEFTKRLAESGIEQSVAKFVWDEFEEYYFAPLTPYPGDRPIGEMHVDEDDLSDMITRFEKRFDRKWVGRWVGPEDPTLLEFAAALLNSTREA